jgi:hypothetical protein
MLFSEFLLLQKTTTFEVPRRQRRSFFKVFPSP